MVEEDQLDVMRAVHQAFTSDTLIECQEDEDDEEDSEEEFVPSNESIPSYRHTTKFKKPVDQAISYLRSHGHIHLPSTQQGVLNHH